MFYKDEEYIQPMLICNSRNEFYPENKEIITDKPVYYKYDGVRCMLAFNRISENEYKFEIAYGRRTVFENITNLYQNLTLKEHRDFELVKKGKYPERIYIDTELCLLDLNATDTSGWINQLPQHFNSDIRYGNNLTNHVFMVLPIQPSNPYVRLAYNSKSFGGSNFGRKNIFKEAESPNLLANNRCLRKKWVPVVVHNKVHSVAIDGIMEYEMEVIPYNSNKRTRYIKKIKRMYEEEVKITSFNMGKGKLTGTYATANYVKRDGQKGKAMLVGTDILRADLTNTLKAATPRLIWATLYYMDLTSKGTPKAPRIKMTSIKCR